MRCPGELPQAIRLGDLRGLSQPEPFCDSLSGPCPPPQFHSSVSTRKGNRYKTVLHKPKNHSRGFLERGNLTPWVSSKTSAAMCFSGPWAPYTQIFGSGIIKQPGSQTAASQGARRSPQLPLSRPGPRLPPPRRPADAASKPLAGRTGPSDQRVPSCGGERSGPAVTPGQQGREGRRSPAQQPGSFRKRAGKEKLALGNVGALPSLGTDRLTDRQTAAARPPGRGFMLLRDRFQRERSFT